MQEKTKEQLQERIKVLENRLTELGKVESERKKAEEELIVSEGKFRTIFDRANDPIFVVNFETGKFLEVNKKACEQLGYTIEEFLQLGPNDIDHPDYKDTVKPNMKRLMKEKKLPPFESMHIAKNGEGIPIIVNCSIIDYLGKPALLAVTHDLRERKKADEELKESEQKYGDLFENANDLIQSVDMDGKFVYVNKMWLETLGYKKEELEKLNLIDILRKDQIPHCMELFKEVAKGKDFKGIEVVFLSKNGKEIMLEGNVNARFQNGKFVATRGIFRDISDRKKVEQELTIKDRAMQSSISAIGITDINGKLIYVNDACVKMWGFDKKEEVIGKSLPEFWEGNKIFETIENMKIKGGEIGEDIGKRKDGSLFNVKFSATLVKNEQGDPQYLFGSFIDITEQKKAEEKIRQAAEEWEKTFNAISDLVFIQDTDYNIIKVNDAFEAALKSKASDLIGKKCYEVLHKSKMHWPGCPFEKTKKDKMPHAVEVDDPNIGIPFWVTTSPVFDDKGEIVASVHIAKDMSEIKNVREELKKKVRDLERFQKVTMGREGRVLELKAEIKKMKAKLGKSRSKTKS